jgi:tripartite-type tricarboxylate transporter receptor subunit TctC
MEKALKLSSISIALLAAMAAHGALAQSPNQPIKILVPITAGGGPDLTARIVGPRLAELLGRPVVVENRVGANGNIAGQLVAQSVPDGRTLLLATDSLIVINRQLYKKMQFDPLKDLVPVTTVTSNEFVLSVNPSVPAKTLPEFIEVARRAVPPLAYASAGNGSQHQLLMEMLKARAGIELLHVPFKGGAAAVAATIAGDTMATFSGGASTAPHAKAGTLRVLAGSGARRSDAFPNVPTVGEFYPGYEGIIWSGLFVPAGTPEPLVARLRAEMHRILAEPGVKDKLNNSGGLQPFITSPREFAEIIRRDSEKYGRVVANIGLTMD